MEDQQPEAPAPKPAATVGRIVHFYTTDPAHQHNGQGEGPYPAVIMQTFGSPYMANLFVMHWGGPSEHGSVSEKGMAQGHNRWWEWPPRV